MVDCVIVLRRLLLPPFPVKGLCIAASTDFGRMTCFGQEDVSGSDTHHLRVRTLRGIAGIFSCFLALPFCARIGRAPRGSVCEDANGAEQPAESLTLRRARNACLLLQTTEI